MSLHFVLFYRQVSVQKRAKFVLRIYALSGHFCVLIECKNALFFDNEFFVSLVDIDFYNATCKKLQTFEYTGKNVSIYVNKLDQSEFVLAVDINDDECFANACKLDTKKKEIIVGDTIPGSFVGQSYSDSRVYRLKFCSNPRVC